MNTPQWRALVLGGKTGLLGRPLTVALRQAGFAVRPTTRKELDPFDATAVGEAITRFGATHLFNTVAYTAVDKAEDEVSAAYRLNRDLPAKLGHVCAETGIMLVHYSTDFVFNGSQNHPYTEQDPTGPQSVYGASKLAGEQALLALDLPRLQILRTAWLFGPGKKNFVKTILRQAKTHDVIRVVADQFGSPTYTLDLAGWSADLAQTEARGLFHAVGSGHASWCDLAAEAVIAANFPCRVIPISSAEYPQRAKRPSYSVLDNSKLARAIGREPRSWLQTVREYVYEEARTPGD